MYCYKVSKIGWLDFGVVIDVLHRYFKSLLLKSVRYCTRLSSQITQVGNINNLEMT